MQFTLSLSMKIETGVKLCQLAKVIEDGEANVGKRVVNFASRPDRKHYIAAPVRYDPRARPGKVRLSSVLQTTQ